MKKVLTLLTAFAFVGLVACGPSAEETKAIEEAAQISADSAADALLKQASETAMPADTAPAVAANPEHGVEGHVCGSDCPGMSK